jgi:hypothetical protein
MIGIGGLLGLMPYGLWRLVERAPHSGLNLQTWGVAAALGIASGVGMNWALQTSARAKTDAIAAGGLALALGVLMIVLTIFLQQRRRVRACNICHRPLGRESVACPRCKFDICRRESCWNVSGKRCADCARLQRPFLALENDAWWTDRVGPRLPRGRCSCCDADAARADLRECGNCTRAMCTRCWDLENGACIKCNWVIAPLPESLELFYNSD